MSPVSVAAERSRNAAWTLWLLFAVAVSFAVLVFEKRWVTPAYRVGVTNWFAGQPLYNGTGRGFIYPPQAALVFAPFTLFPELLGEVLWRWTGIGLFACGVARLTRLVGGDGGWFLIATIVAAPLAFSSARNGQATLPLAGLLLLATGNISDKRWWRATWLLVLALSCKPLAIVLILLTGALHRPLLWRLLIGMLVVVLVPFATQRSEYVVSQYVACVEMLRMANQVGVDGYWSQLFGLLKVAGWELSPVAQNLSRLIAAVVTLFACGGASHRLVPARACFYFYAFGACYLMLFNSRTEGNAYVMVAPVYGVALAEAWYSLKSRSAVIGLAVMIVGTLANYELAKFLTPSPRAVWLSPLMCIGLTVYLVWRLIQESRSTVLETR